MLAHSVFFETLASINDETAPDWRSTVAGLVVLRLIDDWIDAGAQIVTTDITGLRAIRESVNAVSEGEPIRSILHGLVDALEQAETAIITCLTPHLIAYGRALNLGGKWPLSKDVFNTLLKRADAINDDDTCLSSAMELGMVTTRTGEYDDSDAAYAIAEEKAVHLNNLAGQLGARLGCAFNVLARGNLPKADELIGEIIAAAEQNRISRVLSDALQARAHLRALRKDYVSAIRFGYSALEFTDYTTGKDRILANIAASFAELGHLSAARNTHLLVAATTQDVWVRHQTLMNLMEIAIWEAQEPAFHQYRQALADAQFTPEMQVYFHWYSGRGFKAFGDSEKAGLELERAFQLANSYSFNQLRLSIEEEIEKTSSPIVSQPTQEWGTELQEIATAISNMRQLAEAEIHKTWASV
jgi:hypothetical protein